LGHVSLNLHVCAGHQLDAAAGIGRHARPGAGYVSEPAQEDPQHEFLEQDHQS